MQMFIFFHKNQIQLFDFRGRIHLFQISFFFFVNIRNDKKNIALKFRLKFEENKGQLY